MTADMMAPYFSEQSAERLRPLAQRITNRLLDLMEEGPGPGNLVAGLALPMSLFICCEVLGVDPADRLRFATFPLPTLDVTDSADAEVIEGFRGLLARTLVQRLTRPADDLLTVLALAGDDWGPRAERAGLALAVFEAGYETSASTLSGIAYLLTPGLPKRLDLWRHPGPHITSGYGPLQRLWVHVERMELRVAIESLATRFPNLRLAVPESELVWRPTTMRILKELPVEW